QVVIGPTGATHGGALDFDVADAIDGVRAVHVTLNGTTLLPVVVTPDDQSHADFTYHTDTDDLTPITGPTPTPTPPAARVRLYNIADKITAYLNGTLVATAMTGPGQPADTGFVAVTGLRCGTNRFEFTDVNNAAPAASGYTYGVQLEVGGALVVD